jgi:hypothetical protein
MPRLMSCSKAMRVLMMPSGGMPASVTPRCSGTSGRALGKAAVHLDHLARVGVLERDAVAREAELVEQLAVLQALSSIGVIESCRVVLLALGRIDAAAVHADAHRAVVLAGDAGQVAHLVLPRLFALVVVEVAGVVADLVDVRRDRSARR